MTPAVVVSCEHAGCTVPAAYRRLFDSPKARAALRSHRGWDPGAERIARRLARRLGVTPYLHYETRLLVDPNRSIGHPHSLSEYSRRLTGEEVRTLIDEVYRPHRARIEKAVDAMVRQRGRCLHLAIHTFTPVLDGVVRGADVAFLYDPARWWERTLAADLAGALRHLDPELRVRRNYPYRGTSDGLTTSLRRRFADFAYAGVEIEVNQALEGDRKGSRRVDRAVDEVVRQVEDL